MHPCFQSTGKWFFGMMNELSIYVRLIYLIHILYRCFWLVLEICHRIIIFVNDQYPQNNIPVSKVYKIISSIDILG